MSDTIQVEGTIDPINAGYVVFEDLAYVLTVSEAYLVGGWPSWAYRYTTPLDEQFTQSLADMKSGSANIYDGNPVAFLVPAGKFDLGNAGNIIGLVTDYLGVFDDFAVFTDLGDDPTLNGWMQPYSPYNTDAPIGDITTAWSEGSAMMFPPKNARFVVPTVVVNSLPAGKSVYLDAFDMRVVPFNEDPTLKPSYLSPRNLTVKVKPTRLNLTTSPDFTANNVNSNLTVTPDTSQAYGTHTRSGKVAITGTTCSNKETQDTVEVLPEEGFWVTQQYYTPTDLLGTYQIRVDFLTEAGALVSTVLSDDTIHAKTGDDWAAVTLFTAVPANATKARVYRIYASGTGNAADVFWADACLIERSSAKGAFFDGSFGTDYLWKQGAPSGQTWSYYYQDREARNYILTRLLKENVPLGMQVTQPEYATYSGN